MLEPFNLKKKKNIDITKHFTNKEKDILILIYL